MINQDLIKGDDFMVAYNYTRERIVGGAYDNRWDIPNPDRLSTEDHSKYLENEIIADSTITTSLLPCSIVCNGPNCTINFENTLSGAEETSLDALVAAHKNNT